MRVARLLLSFVLSALVSIPCVAQQSPTTTTPPHRDPQAVAIVQHSLAASGGTAAAAIYNARVQGTLAPTVGSYVPAGNFTWLDDFSGATFEFRHELDTFDAVRVQVSGHGSPAVRQGTRVKPLHPHVTFSALPYHLPAVLLSRELANSSYSIEMGESVIVAGKPAVQVIFKNETGVVEKAQSEQRWDFDATSGLPVRIEYRLANTVNALDSIAGGVELSNYKVVDGVSIPFQIAVFEDGKPTSVATIASVTFNVSADAPAFDHSTGVAQ
jgi:hypothetical protein